MRTTIDIADEQYMELKTRAANERTSVKALITEAVVNMLHPQRHPRLRKAQRLPAIGSSSSRTLDLDHDKVNAFLLDIS